MQAHAKAQQIPRYRPKMCIVVHRAARFVIGDGFQKLTYASFPVSDGSDSTTRVHAWKLYKLFKWYFKWKTSTSSSLFKAHNALPWTSRSALTLRSTMAAELYIFSYDIRLVTLQAKAPPQARQMGALKVSMLSPGFVYEPYAPREPIPFWRRWFTRSGWKRTKENIILELKSAYAIAKLRKSGYSKQLFYKEAVEMYKEINTLFANGDKNSLRKAVTEKMYSALKNEIKQRETIWSKVYWELVEPVVKMRTLRARLIGVDRNDVNKVFIQLTIEFLTKQKFEAYDLDGKVVAGDKSKEVLVKDIWVFEKSLFHTGAYWRLCGRIIL